MSFFGFDSSRHNTAAPGFSQAHDPFAGLDNNADGEDALEFDDTYDGLGDQLDETDDAFNDDTFGDTGATTNKVGKDFDFFGQTAKVADAIEEEHLRYNMQKPASKAAVAPAPAAAPPNFSGVEYYTSQMEKKPARTGYEKYKEPEGLPDLHVDQSIWGIAPSKPPAHAPQPVQPGPSSSAPSRKVMSLDEVEAMMRAQTQKSTPQPPATQQSAPESDFLYAKLQQPASQTAPQSALQQQSFQGHAVHGGASARPSQASHGHPIQILQRPQNVAGQQPQHSQQQPYQHHGSMPGQAAQQAQHHGPGQIPQQPTQILPNRNRMSGDSSRMGVPTHPTHRSHGSHHRVPQMTPVQFPSHFSEQEKAAYLEQESKRAKKNHKIWLLSKDNGLMTPQDKNFITRIQLQQLVTATGVPIEHGDEESLNDDFYYQVHSSIRSNQRQNPSQPLNNFAQTYLHQTGGRQFGGRRQNRAAENHVQRMEQQVQRAVEAAKNKPKNPQLVIAGSLGKISYSNAKTPKPLLNIRRTESHTEGQRPRSAGRVEAAGALDRKAVLRNIEKVYQTLMKMEDNSRLIPPPPSDPNDEELRAKHDSWLANTKAMNAKLWEDLKVHEPIGLTTLHPFIAFLSFNKGKKAIPRVFRHITFEQRATILTMIIFHLDQLDVVRGAQLNRPEGLNAAMRENIELFSNAVLPSLFQFFNETDLDIVDGVLEVINKQINVDLVAKTRVGISILTLILSRAELLKQAGGGSAQQWSKWSVVPKPNARVRIMLTKVGSQPSTRFSTLSSRLFLIFSRLASTRETIFTSGNFLPPSVWARLRINSSAWSWPSKTASWAPFTTPKLCLKASGLSAWRM